MPTLPEILADRQTYQDALAWTLGNGITLTLGQLRAMDAESKGAISRAEQRVTDATTAAQAKLDEAKKVNTNAVTLYQNLQAAQAAIAAGRYDDPILKTLFGPTGVTPTNTPTPANDPFAAIARMESDSLLGPIVSVVKFLHEETKKANAANAALQDVNKKMATNYLNGVLEDRYDRIVPSEKQSKYTLEQLITHAVKSNQFATDTTPNIRWAYKDMSSGEVSAAREAELVNATTASVLKGLGFSEAQIAALPKGADGRITVQPPNRTADPTGGNREIFVPTPANFGLDVHNRSGSAPKPFRNLDEAFSAAEKDPDIWRQVDGSVLQ